MKIARQMCMNRVSLHVRLVSSARIAPYAVRHYLNLTNGIEAIPILRDRGVNIEDLRFVRIQSSHCENFDLESILWNLDYDFLMSAAQGYACLMYDFGSRGIKIDDHRNGTPRAFWMGLQWIRYILNYYWSFDSDCKNGIYIKGYNCVTQFVNKRKELSASVVRKIKYFRPYVQTSSVKIYPIYDRTDKDGKKEYYAEILREECSSKYRVNPSDDASLPDIQDFSIERIRELPWESLEDSVEQHYVPKGMFLYRSSDYDDKSLRYPDQFSNIS